MTRKRLCNFKNDDCFVSQYQIRYYFFYVCQYQKLTYTRVYTTCTPGCTDHVDPGVRKFLILANE